MSDENIYVQNHKAPAIVQWGAKRPNGSSAVNLLYVFWPCRMTVLLLLICFWCWPQTRRCVRNLATWLLLPRTSRETEQRIEIFAGWFIPAAVAMAITWMVWHVSVDGEMSGCGYLDIHKCFPLDLLRDLFIHGGIAAGVGGSLHLIMLRDALERARAAEARAEKERERADEMQRQANEAREELHRMREEWWKARSGGGGAQP